MASPRKKHSSIRGSMFYQRRPDALPLLCNSHKDGSIWKGDLSTGKGEVVVSNPGGAAGGLDHDRRSGYLYVAGTSSG